MRIQSRISILALTAALLAMPTGVQAQLNLGVDLDTSTDNGVGVDAGVDLGIGGTDVGVDAGVDVGGDSAVDAEVDVDAGSSGGSGSQLGVDAEVLGDDGLVDVDAGTGSGQTGIGVDVLGEDVLDADISTGTGGSEPVLGVRVSALDDAARLEALIGQVNALDLAGVDLDALVDDTQVSIIALADLLDAEDAAEIRALVEAGGSGRDELLAAIEASVELGAILEREGLVPEDVVTLSIAADGSTELVVLEADATIGLAAAGDTTGDLPETDLADLDIDLLSDEELAEIDLALLPTEEQRLDAVIRLLGDADDGTAGSGDIEVIALDALLGEQALAEVDAVLGGEGSEDVLITADLLDALNDQGLSPEAIVGIDTGSTGPTRVFVNTGLGETGGALGDLAQVDVSIGAGSGGDGNGTGGGTDGGGDDGTDGDGTGGDTDGGGTNGGTGGGTNGGTDGGTDPGTTGSIGGDTDTDTDTGGDAFGTVTVAEIDCTAGLDILSSQQPPSPAALQQARRVDLVKIQGCVTILHQDELAALRAALAAMPELSRQVTGAGLALDDLVGGTLEGNRLTLYFEDDTASA